MKLFEMKHIKKSFDGLEVLKDISLDVEEGEVLSIIGPSGSGKSTILRCATGLETPDSGEIIKNGKIGLVFQNFNLFPHFSVLKNITDAPIKVQKRDKTGFSIIGQQLPILRPGDDVRNEITHGGHRLVPLVGCAAIVFKCSPDQVAFDKEIGVAYRLGPLHIPAIKLMYLPETGDFSACYLNGEHYPIYSYHRLYDYLDSLLIDYRGLIGEGLAVSNHAVKCDPYE